LGATEDLIALRGRIIGKAAYIEDPRGNVVGRQADSCPAEYRG